MSQTEHSTDSIMATETLRQNSENIHQIPENIRHESDIESDNFSENGEVCDLSADKLDPADRELYEKLKQQEREEREEIEKELKAHEDALARHQEELRAREKELRIAQEIMVQREREMLSKHTEEYRAQLAHAHAQALSLSHMGRTPSPKNLKIDTHAVRPELQSHSPFSSQPSPDRFPRVPSHSLSSGGSHSPPDPGSDGRAHHWTFEEQFKQGQSQEFKKLYELSEDPKRKEFLDDLFAYMQKRGTPVNRIPIMAKQTLDLYELFRLVVSKGGLVEVINKKLWREITKGLNLPSSITSAAFTLRTQYMKYLYPYECEKLKMSSPQELQAAIDGNRREGRRSSYGYDLSPGPTLVPASHHLNGTLMNGKIGVGSPSKLWPHMDDHCDADDDSLPPTPIPHPAHLGNRGLTERDAIAMEVATRAMEEATRKMEAASRTPSVDEPARKRMTTEEERLLAHAGMPSAHLKITSRNDGRSEIDNSLVVSMEINGIMYQGVLFAQHPRRM
ncbi:protein dead ringer homolog isoform X2 [Gigantopelta aegis]|uniref:protein dead ringer homolog isoform X2 n=1 Tax=Gigantopelta aegis TaxID=1735272 RepID=UPI001B88988A|nr:protein dead ringer homolog isoform X2 [Gigantopelta aegis]